MIAWNYELGNRQGLTPCFCLLAPLAQDSSNLGRANTAVATCVIAAIQAGSRTYTALYSGDASNAASQTTLSFTVGASGPLDYSDLWWAGETENGWGMTIMQKGDVQFNAFYIYDAQGNPTWFVMPGGTWDTGFSRFTGALYQASGSSLFAYDVSRLTVAPSIGVGSLTFTSANTASFDYTINGVTARKRISRQPFGVRDATPRLAIRDLWWGGIGENGWGISIAQQDRTLFAVWFTYDASGRPLWLVMPGGNWVGDTYSGGLFTTTGSPWLGAVYDPTRLRVTRAGTLSLKFTDQDSATMTYTVNGVTQSKTITRQPF